MKVTVLNPSQYSKWDTFVDQSSQGDVFCYTWWLDAITKSNFQILAIIENDEISAGIPLAYDAQNKVNEPPVTRTLGVLYKPQSHLSVYKQISNQRKWLTVLLEQLLLDDFVQMCLHHNFTDWLPFKWKGFKQTTRYTYIINYEKRTINDLWNKVEPETKRIIRRAGEYGLRTEITDDFELVYQYESMSYERQGLTFRIPYGDLKILDETIKKRGNRVIFNTLDNEDKVHAVLYLAFNHRSVYALLSGSDANLRKLGGHTLVMWEAVKYFSDKVKYFNFGGSDIQPIESHLKGFGGTITPYFHIYNEKLIWKRNDIRHHLNEITFHIKEVYKIVKNKILKTVRRK
jgi:lipid II:glycine glycyltransferase (peptidoglycan interpeptide bridge formation enzyme)